MAARFRFSLQVVLEQRRRAERAIQVEVAKIQAERNAALADIERARVGAQTEREHVRQRLHGRVDPQMLRHHAMGELGGHRRAREAAVRLAAIDARLGAAQERLRGAAAAREALDRLREREFARWRDALARAEEREVDDMNLMRRGAHADDGSRG
ncbi:MAG: hypothetical protein AAFX79_00630 [Planctomycetota bacterium]